MRSRSSLLILAALLPLGTHAQAPSASSKTTLANAAPLAHAVVLGEKAPESVSNLDLKLPLEQKSVRFAVIGDSGTGGRAQYEVGGANGALPSARQFRFRHHAGG